MGRCMRRRKFLIGMGSLAAGGAAAMGTGAVSSVEAERAIDADVVKDTNGMLGFDVTDASLENSQAASMSDGQLELTFDGSGSSSGLNPDSTYHFDNVFQILNQTSEDLHIEFDKSSLDNPAAFNFYAQWTNGGLIGSRDSDYTGQINSGFGINVGITIRTPDQVETDWETGTLVIRTDHPEDKNVN